MEKHTRDLQLGFATSIGGRREQQDNLLIEQTEHCLLAAVCDGMGGIEGGAQASKTALEQLRTLFLQMDPRGSIPEFFLRATDIMDESVCKLQKQGSREPPGTTVVAAIVRQDALYWLSIGDSRLYLIRGDEIVCVTTDHNYQLLIDRALQGGEITPDHYASECRLGDALVSYLGIGGVELMDRNERPFFLKPEDLILLMSDGLYREVSEAEMMRLSAEETDLNELAQKLIDRAAVSAGSSQDNTTVIVLKV